MFYFSRDWKTLIQLPFTFFSLALGYGALSEIIKILKRALFGLANGITTSIYNIINKKWLLVGVQLGLLVGLFIAIGVYNPFPTARTEELFLGLIIPLIPLFSVKENN